MDPQVPMISRRLEADLAFLTGPQAAGRLAGSPGALAAADYLSKQMADGGLQPALSGSYFQPVEVRGARLEGAARLLVGGHEFRHRTDFAAATAVSTAGSGSGPLLVIREGHAVSADALSGGVVLIPETPSGFDLRATALAAAEHGVIALLVGSGQNLAYKSVFAGEGILPVFRLSLDVAERLAGQAGTDVTFALPLARHATGCNNVVGVLPGSRQDRALVLTAHYDHLGDDPDGTRYPGALDNASGVAAVMEAVRVVAGRQGKLPFSVVAAFLTGEESGLWGANTLVRFPPCPLSAVINLDSVGWESALRALRMGHAKPDSWLSEVVADVLASKGIKPRWTQGSDDSRVFIRAGIPTVGLGQEREVERGVGMHTPGDTLEALHLPVVQGAADLLVCIADRIAASPHPLVS